ncbi:MAG TPA: hypothetical protein VGX37_06175 [Allosphingosinicella sp.]|jgi:hypothetical protein|nr:hypothetical protein [Allosphingosinicella sp.]
MLRMPTLAWALAVVLLAGCDARFGNDAAPVADNATAAGRAEEGRLTVEAPGLNLSINIPESVRANARVDEDGLLYPGASLAGMHVQGRPGAEAHGHDEGEVELRFTTADPPQRVVAWYRDPARNDQLTVQSARRQGSAFVLSGTGRDEGRFTVTLTPGAGGGTEGRLLLSNAR